MAYEFDPPEMIGDRDSTIKADHVPPASPAGLRRAAPATPGVAHPIAPAPTVGAGAVASSPTVGEHPGSHPKIAHLRPKVEYEKAVIDLADARLELNASHIALRTAEKAEGACLAEWISLNPNPLNPNRLLRDNAVSSLATRHAAAAAGLDPNAGSTQTANPRSPIDRAALARGRHAGGNAQKAGTPLRSNVTRRTV
jgi:hypothetical protein